MVEKSAEERLDEGLHAAFQKLDKNKDTTLSAVELKEYAHKLGANISEEEFLKAIQSCDEHAPNKSKVSVKLEEILEFGPPLILQLLSFMLFDENNDHFIDKKEFAKMTELLGGDSAPAAVEAKFNSYDANHDGMITFEELLKGMEKESKH